MASSASAPQIPSINTANVGPHHNAQSSNASRGRGRGAPWGAYNQSDGRRAQGTASSRGQQNRGNRNRNDNFRTPRRSDAAAQSAPPIPPPPGIGGGGSFSGRLTKDAESIESAEGKTAEADKQQEGQDESVEAEVCFICASPVVHTSLAPCNHRTCHICALRLRALYKTRACAHCRVC